ncbi:DUF2800 domain-containing protein [Corynebacterium resistens]
MRDQHALLNTSGTHRWLACSPSVTLEAGLPGPLSQAAEQGTAVYGFAECVLASPTRASQWGVTGMRWEPHRKCRLGCYPSFAHVRYAPGR